MLGAVCKEIKAARNITIIGDSSRKHLESHKIDIQVKYLEKLGLE